MRHVPKYDGIIGLTYVVVDLFLMLWIYVSNVVVWFYNLRVASSELRVVSCDFKKINLRVASSFLRVEK